MPKISVIMPFYNCEKFLDESISSILGQTFSDFEFIIINDASTDSSDDIIAKYLSDPRITYIKNLERKGIVFNLNNAFNFVHSDIIARMDGDDISDIFRLEKQYNFLQENPHISIVGSYLQVIDSLGNRIRSIQKPTTPEGVRLHLLKFLTIFHASAMIRLSVYHSIGYYLEKYLYCEDTEWTFRAIYGDFLGSNIPETLYSYRYHNASTHNQSRKKLALIIYRLKLETKKKYKIHVTILDYIVIVSQLLFGYFFSGRCTQSVEYYYKRYFLKERHN